MNKVRKEFFLAIKSGTNIFLICFYVIFYSFLFHYIFEILVFPRLTKVGPVVVSNVSDPIEDHEFLVSEQKKVLSEFGLNSEIILPPGPEDFSLKTTVSNIYEFNENLPYSGFRDRECTLGYRGASDSCNFKLHTTSSWHWGYRRKSYDIETMKPLQDIQSSRLSLMRPKFLFFPSTVIYSEIARKYGIYTPEQKIVSFYLNDEYQGPYILKEKADSSFVAKTIKQPGFIMGHNSKEMIRGYKSAFLGMTLEQYSNRMETNSMMDPESWSISGFVGTEFRNDILDRMFEKLRHVEKLDEVFDFEYAAKQYALDSIFGIHHRDNSINNSWFVNSSSQKLYYIPSDSGPFLYTDDYSKVSKMDFTKLLLKNKKFTELVDQYLYFFTVKENIYAQIKKDVLRYEEQMRLPIKKLKLLATVHPISFGAMGSTEVIFGTYFHSFSYEDYSNEAYLNLASLLRRQLSIKRHLDKNRKVRFDLDAQKSAKRPSLNCTIFNSKNLISDIKKNCPREAYEIDEKTILFKNLQTLTLNNVSTKDLNREKIIFSNIRRLRIHNYVAPSNSPGLVTIGVQKIIMENVEINDVFGIGISLNNSEAVELKNVRLDRILKIGIDCLDVLHFVRDSVVVGSSYQDIKIKNCY